MNIRWIRISMPLLGAIITASFLTAGVPEVPTAALTRESALEAWETVQKSDPQTLTFERIGERRYRFSTERFPFNGELEVVNVAIDDIGAVDLEDTIGRIAIVETEFIGLRDEFHRRHIQSIGMWERNNTLYFDADTDSWLSFTEWRDAMAAQYPSNPGGSWLYTCMAYSNWLWLGLIGILLVVLLTVGRQASRQIKRTMAAQDKVMKDHGQAVRRQEESIQLTKESMRVNEQTNQLLGSILEELKKSA